MDILYVLGHHSKWEDNELRYSLRSLEKYGKNIDNMYLIGYNPGFLSDKINILDYTDTYKHIQKQKNILKAICYAVDYFKLDEFLYSSDDHFYIKETDFDNYPYFSRGELSKNPDTIKAVVYRKSLKDTRNILEHNGYTYYNFSQHGNTHMSKQAIYYAKLIIEKSYSTLYGCEPTCILLNVLYKYKKFPIIQREDVKIFKDFTTKEDLLNRLGDREVFSISNETLKVGMKECLQELFPYKSKYEL
ncbi:MAG: hypothetical protein J6Y28_09650 [Acholeplasmatales bacterium]|nr:hypothetical protein [Methanobrevibacter sp.]MBP5446422.1 hypothetical protein [Acholeplasmatales bacterium]